MCYERTKIKICHNVVVTTFLIPSASFLHPSWISTVTFHLHITSRVFPSTQYRPVQYHVSWACMAAPNFMRVTTLRPRHIHDTHAVSDYVLLLHNTKFRLPLRLTVQCQLNKKTFMHQQLIIVYLIIIICNQ